MLAVGILTAARRQNEGEDLRQMLGLPRPISPSSAPVIAPPERRDRVAASLVLCYARSVQVHSGHLRLLVAQYEYSSGRGPSDSDYEPKAWAARLAEQIWETTHIIALLEDCLSMARNLGNARLQKAIEDEVATINQWRGEYVTAGGAELSALDRCILKLKVWWT